MVNKTNDSIPDVICFRVSDPVYKKSLKLTHPYGNIPNISAQM